MKPSWENINSFFGDFAVEIAFSHDNTQITVKGIFDESFYLQDIGEADFTDHKPRFVTPDTHFSILQRGMTCTIDNKQYRITEIARDGTGLMTVFLVD